MSQSVKKLYRSEKDKMLGGVAGGLGDFLQLDSTIVRIGFLALCLLWGAGLFLYVAMWLIVPSESAKESGTDAVSKNFEEIKEKAVEAGNFVKSKVEDITEKQEEQK